ncbi:MAG TPA: patatin-like phospholipase family protein, partial [Burkholderiaceae bacterium]|nr:patatin-like phospholipase family protein [Burkholderiaceae bacterium]
MPNRPPVSGQVVLVLQGGGALGAYQGGVYQAMHEQGMEPDWVIGTSIGAINGALIAGNRVERRLERLKEFWSRVSRGSTAALGTHSVPGQIFTNFSILAGGVSGFFSPRALGWLGIYSETGVDRASFYNTDALKDTLCELVDTEAFRSCEPRLTVGAVNVCTGTMRYFDSRDETLTIDHIRASGALPPYFGAVRIGSEAYWDGGIYSNTPIEAILDDRPRRDSLIFAVQVWQPKGAEPPSIWQVMARQKDIQYASRDVSHLARQRQIHRLRHIIRELSKLLPPEQLDQAHVQQLVAYGCGTTMHVVHLQAPCVDGENHTKDIDFTSRGVKLRWDAGYADAVKALARKAWLERSDPIEGIV